jgi:F0F1-type ATP synthase membrane subunit c/vacuolar-type H+-ATPase subunit K
MRIFHAAFLVTIALWILLLIKVAPQEREIDRLFPVLFYFLAIMNVGAALFVRGFMLGPAEEKLQIDAEDRAALFELRKAYIFSFALCESAALFGFVLRFLGASWTHAGALFAIAVIGLLLCTPRRP